MFHYAFFFALRPTPCDHPWLLRNFVPGPFISFCDTMWCLSHWDSKLQRSSFLTNLLEEFSCTVRYFQFRTRHVNYSKKWRELEFKLFSCCQLWPSFYHTFWKSKQFQPVCRLAWNSWERSLNMLHLQWSWHWSLRASHCKCWRRRLWAEYLDQTHVVSFSSFCTHRAQDVGPSMTMLNGVSFQEIAGLNLAIWNPTPWWSHLKKSRRAHFAVSSPSPSKARQSYPKKQT